MEWHIHMYNILYNLFPVYTNINHYTQIHKHFLILMDISNHIILHIIHLINNKIIILLNNSKHNMVLLDLEFHNILFLNIHQYNI